MYMDNTGKISKGYKLAPPPDEQEVWHLFSFEKMNMKHTMDDVTRPASILTSSVNSPWKER